MSLEPLLPLVLFAAAGLGSVLLALPTLQLAIKAAGSAYLVWLAWQLGRSGSPGRRTSVARPTSLIGGAWLLWYNPKAWAMTAGAAASFASLADGPTRLAALLGATFGLCAALSLSLWCLAGQMLAGLLTRDWHWRVLNSLLALLLVASVVATWRE